MIKKLYEIVDFNPKESLKKGNIAKKISMDQLLPFCRDVKGYTEEEFSGGMKFRNGDTIMARITPCLENGKTAQISVLEDGEIGFGSTEYIVFRAKAGITDSNYIYYLVCSPAIREPAIKSMVGSSGRQRVQLDVIQNLDIPIPPLEEQKKIGTFLSKIDEKISLNNNINDNLEQQASVIFSQWFMPYINGHIVTPDGWEFKPITEIDVVVTDYVANGSFKSLADNVQYLSEETNNVLIRLTDYNNGFNTNMVYLSDTSYNFLAKSQLFGDEVIISNVGANVGTVFRCPRLKKNMSLAPNAIMLSSKKYQHYLYLYFTSSYGQQLLQSIVTGSAQPKFNKTNFRSLQVMIPSPNVIDRFNEVYSSIYEQIVQNQMENSHLLKIRDILLPKLMSGELDASNIDI